VLVRVRGLVDRRGVFGGLRRRIGDRPQGVPVAACCAARRGGFGTPSAARLVTTRGARAEPCARVERRKGRFVRAPKQRARDPSGAPCLVVGSVGARAIPSRMPRCDHSMAVSPNRLCVASGNPPPACETCLVQPRPRRLRPCLWPPTAEGVPKPPLREAQRAATGTPGAPIESSRRSRRAPVHSRRHQSTRQSQRRPTTRTAQTQNRPRRFRDPAGFNNVCVYCSGLVGRSNPPLSAFSNSLYVPCGCERKRISGPNR